MNSLKFNVAQHNYDVSHLLEKIMGWHYDRNLIEGSEDIPQLEKLMEEVGELRLSINNQRSPVDDIGDIIVVLVNIAERNGLTIQECLAYAYSEIQHRTGKMVDGVFKKDA